MVLASDEPTVLTKLPGLCQGLLEPEYQTGVVVDGFPRTKVQAEAVKLLHDQIMQLRAAYWGTPALRKYLETMISAATCDQPAGISTSFISKTTEPSGLVIREVRVVQAVDVNGSTPACV